MKNIVLVGMPFCGKTTIGSLLAQRIGSEFYDTDKLIEQSEGAPPSEIIKAKGEQYFRATEEEIIKQLTDKKAAVISTGGGAVLLQKSVERLQQNGVIVYIERNIEALMRALKGGGRPLTTNANSLADTYAARKPIYEAAADLTVQNNSTLQTVVDELAQISSKLTPKKLCVIGSPIEHSRSPELHTPVIKRFCSGSSYERVLVEKEQLAGFCAAKDYDGFNVTMPHKTAILSLLDEVSNDAALFGAVNTVVNISGKLQGHNTDAEGFVKALLKNNVSFSGANVAVLGCGGAGGALALKAAISGAASVTVHQNNTDKSDKIISAADKIGLCGIIKRVAFLQKISANTNILINATPLGMSGNQQFENFDFLHSIQKTTTVCDLIYSPQRTVLLETAAAMGCKTMGGAEMLAAQALLSDRLFLGLSINEK